jgi:hypothetical protein
MRANAATALDHHLRNQEETMSTIPAQPPPGDSGDSWTRSVVEYANVTDSIDGHLERRVAALEEALMSRRARRRLRRMIRETNANFPAATFTVSRFEATGNDWLVYGHQGGPAVGVSR